MNIDNFFAELKRRNVYKVAVAYYFFDQLSLRRIANFSAGCDCRRERRTPPALRPGWQFRV